MLFKKTSHSVNNIENHNFRMITFKGTTTILEW